MVCIHSMPIVLFSLGVRGWWWPSLIHSFFRRWRPSPMPFAFPRIDGKPLIIRTYMNLKLKTSIDVCIYIYIHIYCCIKFRFLSWSGFGSCYHLSRLGGWGQASHFPLGSDANPIRKVDGCRHPLNMGKGDGRHQIRITKENAI